MQYLRQFDCSQVYTCTYVSLSTLCHVSEYDNPVFTNFLRSKSERAHVPGIPTIRQVRRFRKSVNYVKVNKYQIKLW
jgi:hypothetical protein